MPTPVTGTRSSPPTRLGVALALGLCLALASVACARPVPGVPASGRSAVASPSASTLDAAGCPAPGVRITAQRPDAAAGYRAMALLLTNCGTRDYQLSGRPDIVVLDERGAPLGVAVVPSVHYTASPRRITAKPGTGCMAVLSWRNTVTDPTVVATTGAFLSVAPVRGAARQIVRLPNPMDLGNTGRLEASAWL